MINQYLRRYLEQRPLFLSLIRAKELELFCRYLTLRKPVLDVGCGDGFFAKTLLQSRKEWRGKTIDIGLDVEDSRQMQAKDLHVYKTLTCYDGHSMPFSSDTFGTAVSNCVLEHIPNVEEVIREIYRVLKPGGTFVVSVMAKPWEEYLIGNMVMGNSYKRWMRKKQVHFNLFTHAKWSRLFVKVGFILEQQIGYLDSRTCRAIDLGHYLSIPSLLSYVVCKKWVLWPILARMYPIGYLSRMISPDVEPEKSGALFYILRKPSR